MSPNDNDDQILTEPIYDLISHYTPNYEEDNNTMVDHHNIHIHKCEYTSTNELSKRMIDNNRLSILNLNIQSLRAHWGDLNLFLNEFSKTKAHFNIIGLTEVFTIAPGTHFSLDGYHPLLTRTRPPENGIRGGVGLFIDEQYIVTPRHDLQTFIPHVIESIYIEVQRHKSERPIIIGTIYRPNTPPKADLAKCIQIMQETTDKISSENKLCYLMGDLNIDLLKYNEHNQTKEYLDSMISSGFLPHITKPTHVTDRHGHRSATIIDHIFSNNTKDNTQSGIIISDISDHFATYHLVERASKYKGMEQRQFRKFNETNIDAFKIELANTKFDKILGMENPDQAYNAYINIYKEVFDRYFPLKTIKMTRKYTKREPWVTSGILTSSIKKTKLYKKKLKVSNEQNQKKYRDYCKIYRKVIRYAKVNYYTTKLVQYKHDMKETWKILNNALHRNTNSPKLPTTFEINKQMVTNAEEIAESFNTFFNEIAQNICDKIPQAEKQYTEYFSTGCPKSFFIHPITKEDLINNANKLKSKTSSGIDNISTKLLKETIPEIAAPLVHIFNRSFASGIVPDELKIAKIIPIHKGGDKKQLNNYRPISLLPSHSKLMEKIICTQLLNFLENNNVLYEHQYGFRKKRSTIQPITKLLWDIANENDKPTKNLTTAIFIDLSKAFDTLNHDKLLTKLDNCGIRGHSNDWFRNYLYKRKHCVNYNGSNSKLLDIHMGVPQGSILGPILFLIYINDIKNATNLNLLSYADDTTVYKSGATLTDMIPEINNELDKLNQWFNSNKLSLNVAKTNYMVFTPNNNYVKSNQKIKIDGKEINQAGNDKQSKYIKFLGIYMDENLTWKYHIENMLTKINRSIYAINLMKNFLPKYALRTIYQTLVESHLNYGIQLWGNSTKCNKLEKTQKKVIRYINTKPRLAHTDPLFNNSKILKLNDLYRLHSTLFMHDFKNKRLPNCLDNLFKNNHNRTRQLHNMVVYKPRTTYSAKLPKHQFVKIWNELPAILQTCKSRGTLKAELKKKILNTYETDVKCTNIACPDCR